MGYWYPESSTNGWYAQGTSIKTGWAHNFGAYVAYGITMQLNFVTTGTIEFKYRKDSQAGYEINGEFKFVMDEGVIFSDKDPMRNKW